MTLVPVNPPSVATLTLNVWFQLPPPPEGWVAWNVAGPVVVGTSWQPAAEAEPAVRAIGAITAAAARPPRMNFFMEFVSFWFVRFVAPVAPLASGAGCGCCVHPTGDDNLRTYRGIP